MNGTPGPWSIREGTNRLIVDELGHIVATTEPSNLGIADARLIVAAPDMLAALKALVDTGDRAPLELRMARGRLAIAKAEGHAS